MSGYDFLKSQVLSCWRKVESVCDVVISSGRVFQTRGPATVNARSPTVGRLTDGTIRRLVPPERNVRRSGRSATGTSGPRYRGALACKTLYVSTVTLLSIRSGTCSHWCKQDFFSKTKTLNLRDRDQDGRPVWVGLGNLIYLRFVAVLGRIIRSQSAEYVIETESAVPSVWLHMNSCSATYELKSGT